MNKAFVKESEDDDGDDDAPEAQLPAGTRNYMTKRGHVQIRTEFEHLVKVERPAIVQVVSWAAGNGDRSENGDYIYGKKRLREIDRRVRFLIKRLENAEVVDAAGRDSDQVFFGATVSFMTKAGGERTVTIVGVDEVDTPKGRISWISPVARALIKAREGDAVQLRTPAGLEELEILDVKYLPID